MITNWLLRLFGLSEIVAKQAFEIDRLQMNCDMYEQLAIVDADIIRKLAEINLIENN